MDYKEIQEALETKWGEMKEKMQGKADAEAVQALEKSFNELKAKAENAASADNIVSKEDYSALETKANELQAYADKLSNRIEQMEQQGATKNQDALTKALKEWTESEAFKEWAENMQGKSPRMELKYDFTNDRTGNVLISSRSNRISDEFQPRRLHVRNLMTVTPTDQPHHYFDKVSSYTPGIDMVSETGEAPSLDIATTEKSVEAKRIAGYMTVSNRVFRSANYLVSHLRNRLPEKLNVIEDFQLLFGDGNGENLEGIYGQATTMDMDGPTFSAGAFASVASYDGGDKALITFTNNHGLTNAYTITIANATEASYNATHQVNVKNEKEIVIDLTYVAEDPSAWTATSAHYLKGYYSNATIYDVLTAARAYMANDNYQVSGYVLNPATVEAIKGLKATDDQYLAVGFRQDGTLTVSGIPVIESNSMPAGQFLAGDFQGAAELLQYDSVSLRVTEGDENIRKNQRQIYISEELLLPVYNPFMFVKGKLADLKTAIST